jgi:hypothetical protein
MRSTGWMMNGNVCPTVEEYSAQARPCRETDGLEPCQTTGTGFPWKVEWNLDLRGRERKNKPSLVADSRPNVSFGRRQNYDDVL